MCFNLIKYLPCSQEGNVINPYLKWSTEIKWTLLATVFASGHTNSNAIITTKRAGIWCSWNTWGTNTSKYSEETKFTYTQQASPRTSAWYTSWSDVGNTKIPKNVTELTILSASWDSLLNTRRKKLLRQIPFRMCHHYTVARPQCHGRICRTSPSA